MYTIPREWMAGRLQQSATAARRLQSALRAQELHDQLQFDIGQAVDVAVGRQSQGEQRERFGQLRSGIALLRLRLRLRQGTALEGGGGEWQRALVWSRVDEEDQMEGPKGRNGRTRRTVNVCGCEWKATGGQRARQPESERSGANQLHGGQTISMPRIKPPQRHALSPMAMWTRGDCGSICMRGERQLRLRRSVQLRPPPASPLPFPLPTATPFPFCALRAYKCWTSMAHLDGVE